MYTGGSIQQEKKRELTVCLAQWGVEIISLVITMVVIANLL